MPYNPPGNVTSSPGLTHLATVYYKKKGLDVLKKKMRFSAVVEPDIIPLRSGQTVQYYRYTLPIANTTPSGELVGTSLALATTTISATVSQYSDFYSLSTLLQDTAIDPIVENTVEMAAYRGALTADTINRTEFDSNVGVASVGLSTLGGALSAADFRRAKALLNGKDVREGPRGAADFVGIVHPYPLYDLMSDNSAGGFIDVNKYSRPEVLINQSEEGMINGIRLVSTTNVGTSGTAPTVLYYTYIVGKGAVGSVDLAGSAPSDVEDPDKQAFKTYVVKGGPNTADPEGNIGSFVSYRFVTVAKTLDTTNYRYIIIKADASLV